MNSIVVSLLMLLVASVACMFQLEKSANQKGYITGFTDASQQSIERNNMSEEKKTLNTKYITNRTLKDALQAWDNDVVVTSIEMGGIGPGYEQVIQIGIFELCKHLIDRPIPDVNVDKDLTNTFFDEELLVVIHKTPALEGMSGAQAGAIKNVAYKFLSRGYIETLETVPEDRSILVTKNFPTMEAAL